jgi:predicted nucleic acid-binding protein
MIVVADTSPLNYLIRLGHPDILREIYGRVLVPHAVLMEMQHPDAPPEVRAWASAPPAWLEHKQVQQLDGTLASELGAGEREAISLALEVAADVLLIDERAGRQQAEARHIEVGRYSCGPFASISARVLRFSRSVKATPSTWISRFASS